MLIKSKVKNTAVAELSELQVTIVMNNNDEFFTQRPIVQNNIFKVLLKFD